MLPQLQAFAAVADYGRMGAAASALYLTQPALTTRIQRLERELGAPLFTRTSSGMRLTDAGRAFLPFARRALEAVDEGRRSLDELARGLAGRITIGAAPAVSTYVLPEVLSRFRERHPGVEVGVRTGHSEEIVELVLQDRVQVGFVRSLRHPRLAETPFYLDELVLVTGPEHAFAADDRVRIEQLGGEPLILFDRSSSYHELTSAAFRSAGVQPRGVMELDNIDAAKKMVRLGLGIAILPHTSVIEEVGAGTLVAVLLVGAPSLARPIVAVLRRDAPAPGAALRGLLDTLAEVAPGGRPGGVDAAALVAG